VDNYAGSASFNNCLPTLLPSNSLCWVGWNIVETRLDIFARGA